MGDLLDRCVLSRIVSRRAEWEPDRVALVFENRPRDDEVVTFADLAVKGNRLAHRLKSDGLRPGSRVAIMMRNHPEFIYGYFANSRLAVDTVPVDPRARGDKLRYFFAFADSDAVILADYLAVDEDVAQAIADTGLRAYVVSTAEGRADGIDLSERFTIVNEVLDGAESPTVSEHVTDLARPWILAYTSGTTGDPKAILFGYDRLRLYALAPSWFGYGEDDVPYTGLSLIHGNALIVTLMPSLWGRVDHSVFSRWFTRSRLWDVCRDYGATSWSNLGGIATGVYSNPPSDRDRDHRVRTVISAGMPRELWRPFEERYGVRVLEWYGTMEGGFAYHPVGFGPVGSFGKPPGDILEMDVVDEDGRSVPPDGRGELIARPVGAAAQLAYYKNPEASAKKIRDGWLHTGDIASRDANGWMFFEHRKEEGGLRKMGEFIAESFVSRAVAEYPEVEDVHIYGIPARSGAPGETDIVAAVVVDDPEHFDVDRLLEHCRARLEPSHVPDVVQPIIEMPLTATAKVQRRFLMEMLERDRDRVGAGRSGGHDA